MKFFNHIPTIQAFDTEAYRGNLKVICSADGEYYEYDSPVNLLEWLIANSSDLNYFYNLDYDFSVILKPILKALGKKVKDKDKFEYNGYTIRYISGKAFSITNTNKHGKKKRLRYFDIAQFYKDDKGFKSLDSVAKEYLNIGKNNKELDIDREKIGEERGYYEANRDKIIKYCINDAVLTREISKIKVISVYKMLGHIPKGWYSNASISKSYLELKHSNLAYSYYNLIKQLKNPTLAHNIIVNSYKGGIFYLHSLGKNDNVYEYDLNSAYPKVISELYGLKDSEIEYTREFKEADYGFYHVKLWNNSDLPIAHRTGKTEITYVKSPIEPTENYLTQAEIEYFLKYHKHDIKLEIIEGVVINTQKLKEFPDFIDLYGKRKTLKNDMKERKALRLPYVEANTEQWNVKTILNATYGCFAERRNGYTKWSNYVYASYITAITRIRIYEVIDKIGWDNIIGIMTDAVLTNKEINDAYFNSDNLGYFKLEGKFDVVWLYQNGIYISKNGSKITLHNRGFPTLNSPEILLNATGNKIEIKRKSPLKIKEAIIQRKTEEIGDFVSKDKIFSLEANRWKYLLDVDKLRFEYLKEHSLETDYMFNIDLNFEYMTKPIPIDLNLKNFKKTLAMSNKAISDKVKTEDIIIDTDKAIADINNKLQSNNSKRDLQRYIEKLQRNTFVRVIRSSDEINSVHIADEAFIISLGQ